MEVRYQVQIEKAKNMEIQAKQIKESFEHKLDMLFFIKFCFVMFKLFSFLTELLIPDLLFLFC